MSDDKAARIAANAEALYHALRALTAMAEEDQVQREARRDGEWGACRNIDELERDGALPDEIMTARNVLRRIEDER